MGRFTVKEIRLHRVHLPLKQSFSTHLQTVTARESIFVEVIDENGQIGLGECVAFSSPWYTEETVQTCWDALKKWLIPLVIGQEIEHPSTFFSRLASVKGNRMAKASLDQAVWDLYAKNKGVPLWKLVGGIRQEIDAGVVLTGPVDQKMWQAVEAAIQAGYKRVKLKVDGETNPEQLKKLVASYHELLFFADGNGIFDQLGLDALLAFDQVGLALIEQPFGEDEWALHQQATQLLQTPIALDESIRSVADVQRMIDMKAGAIIVLKPGRVGGITESLHIHKLAVDHRLPVWIGGMIEFGVSKAHNLALASLPQFTLPGDFSASTHFWHEDVVEPVIDLFDGKIFLSEAAGIGYALNIDVMKKYVVDGYVYVEQ